MKKALTKLAPPPVLFFCLCALALIFASCDSSGGSDSDTTDGAINEEVTDGGSTGTEGSGDTGSGSDAEDTTWGGQTEFPVSEDIEVTGWDEWKDYTLTFTLAEAASVTIGVEGTLANNNYLYLDNMELYSITDTNTNFVTNGDFESDDNYGYGGWGITAGGQGDSWVSYSVASDSYASNNKTDYITMSNETGSSWSVSATQTITLQAGTYTASIEAALQDKNSSGESSLAFTAYLAE